MYSCGMRESAAVLAWNARYVWWFMSLTIGKDRSSGGGSTLASVSNEFLTSHRQRGYSQRMIGGTLSRSVIAFDIRSSKLSKRDSVKATSTPISTEHPCWSAHRRLETLFDVTPVKEVVRAVEGGGASWFSESRLNGSRTRRMLEDLSNLYS